MTWCLGLGLAWGTAGAAPPAPGKRGRTTPPPSSLSTDNIKRALQRFDAAAPAAPKSQPDVTRLVALRIEFPNLRFGESPPADELHDRFFYEVWFEHVREYFSIASNGRAEVSVFVPDSVALAVHEQEHYGEFTYYDSLMVQLTGEAVAFFDPDVDFSAYDGIILLHAGPGQESDIAGDSPLQIWSGYLDQAVFEEQLSTPDTTITGIPTDDGVEIRDVVILPEWQVQDLPPGGGARLGHLGVYVHEIGQKIGMIPMFDADPAPFPNSQGLGNFGLMGYGLWVANGFIPSLPGAFNRALVGWADPIEVDGDEVVELRDYQRGPPDSIVARVPISAREYFLVTYVVEDPDGPLDSPCDSVPRRYFNFNDANADCVFNYEDVNGDGVMSEGDIIDTYAGAEWDFFMTDLGVPSTAGEGWGLLIVHVDELVFEEVLERSNNVQGDPRRKAVDVEEADAIQDLDRFPDNVRAFGSADDYFAPATPFGVSTNPDSRSTNGAPSGIEIQLVDLPELTPSPIDPNVLLPGSRARVDVRRNAGTSELGLSPQRTARRVISERVGADLVTLPLGTGSEALVVPADSGRIYLLDPQLDDLPQSDGNPATLAPWVTLPLELAGVWAASPAVGDLGNDGIPDVVLAANADSLTRLFGWDHAGAGLDGGNPLLGSLRGTGARVILFDVDLQTGDQAVLAAQSDTGVSLLVHPPPLVACPLRQNTNAVAPAGNPGWQLLGGPVGVRWPVEPCGEGSGVAWVEADTLTGNVELWYRDFSCCDSQPQRVPLPGAAPNAVRMVAGDLNGDRAEVVVVADGSGSLFEVRGRLQGLDARRLATLAQPFETPLALGDVDANGTLEIIAAAADEMHVLSFSGAALANWPYRFDLDPRLAIESAPAQGAGSPLVADLDGDAHMEIVLHLRSGPALVWDGDGNRRGELETALAAVDAVSPRLADLDADGTIEVTSLARFDRFVRFDPVTRERITEPRTEVTVWRWPQSGNPAFGSVAWSGLGGGSKLSFHADDPANVVVVPNESTLPSFIVVPNPASDAMRARVQLTAAARVYCALYNLEGQVVHQDSRQGQAGEVVEFTFDVRHVASGIYLARMELSTGAMRLRPVAVRH